MKLENRTGRVTKLTGKRRKPWCAKVFVGWKVDDVGKKASPRYKAIGYYAKKTEAYKALLSYTEDQEPSTVTLSQVYDEWSAIHFKTISDATKPQYTNAWRHIASIHNVAMSSLKVADIESAIEIDNPPRTVRGNIKTLLSALYQYAMAHEYCEKDYSQLINVQGDKASKIVRKVFTPEEVADLFTKSDVVSDILLIGIYTGMRPNEVIDLMIEEVDLTDGFLRIRGSKTKSGLLRDIPLHADILPIIERNLKRSAKFKRTRAFVRDDGESVSYHWVYRHMKTMGNHLPHDTRHSFVTYARRSGMDQLAVKRIVGHSTNRDVTEDTYTHTDDDFLREAMKKYRIA